MEYFKEWRVGGIDGGWEDTVHGILGHSDCLEFIDLFDK